MTVIDKLKEAIISERWDIVIEVFQEFGGKLEDAKESVKKKSKKTTASKILDMDKVPYPEKPIVKKSSNDNFLAPIKGQNNKQRDNSTGRTDESGNEIRLAYSRPLDISKSKINLWEDDLTVATKDIEFSKKVIVKSPVARESRQDATEIQASCKSCGRVDKVLPMFAQHYRCDRCMVASR